MMSIRAVALAALLVPVVALAGPPRDMATVCAGRPTGDDLAACGAFHMNAYSSAPEAPAADEHLYNAGVMYSEGAAIGAALQAFQLLRKYFPNGKLAARAIVRSARLYAQVVMYDKAAEALEEYGTKYAGEKDAYDAMSDAVFYRKAIGDDDKVIEDTRFLVRTFGAKKPAEAAAAYFSLTAIYEKHGDRDATIKHLREYIRQYSSRGGTSNLVIAHGKLGQQLWDDSCPVKPVDGACVRIKRARQPAGCSGSLTSVELVKRDTKKVKDALAAFETAIKSYEKSNFAAGDEAGARYYYARAQLARVDADSEALLVAKAPASGAARSKWMTDQVALRGKLISKYERVLQTKDAATSIVVASRIARQSDVLASAIIDAGTTKAECDKLAVEAEPIRSNAILAFGVCLAKATELAWFDDEGGRSCERALVRLAGDRFPALHERLGAATNPAPVIVTSGPK